jgi:hypothetical protein
MRKAEAIAIWGLDFITQCSHGLRASSLNALQDRSL